MKRVTIVVLVLALSLIIVGAVAIISISGPRQSTQSTQTTQSVQSTNEQLAAAWPTVVYMTSNQTYFISNQTPCSVSNNITGVVTFWPSQDNSTIYYMAWLGGNDGITQVALHLKQNGQVGEPVVYLYAPGVMVRSVTKVEKTSGLLAAGNFSASNFVGPLSGQSMVYLSERIAEGNISVIASTTQCPHMLRGEFGIYPFQMTSGQGAQGTTPSPQNTPGQQHPQGNGTYGPCQGGYCGPMGPGSQGPYGPMGPGYGPMMNR